MESEQATQEIEHTSGSDRSDDDNQDEESLTNAFSKSHGLDGNEQEHMDEVGIDDKKKKPQISSENPETWTEWSQEKLDDIQKKIDESELLKKTSSTLAPIRDSAYETADPVLTSTDNWIASVTLNLRKKSRDTSQAAVDKLSPETKEKVAGYANTVGGWCTGLEQWSIAKINSWTGAQPNPQEITMKELEEIESVAQVEDGEKEIQQATEREQLEKEESGENNKVEQVEKVVAEEDKKDENEGKGGAENETVEKVEVKVEEVEKVAEVAEVAEEVEKVEEVEEGVEEGATNNGNLDEGSRD
eukprot:TRINITY_DN16880_c0_g1_i1.p1 TRINITY_DN16880_c0_g1~~TRINITY_DN16880_c0_g1_i1.p1  ORF type:complete len:302 (-),score=99.52 TRINITY_DN16880_c0_g1_i1:75-980(-)